MSDQENQEDKDFGQVLTESEQEAPAQSEDPSLENSSLDATATSQPAGCSGISPRRCNLTKASCVTSAARSGSPVSRSRYVKSGAYRAA